MYYLRASSMKLPGHQQMELRRQRLLGYFCVNSMTRTKVRPTNGFDTGALIGAFGALCFGSVGTFMVLNAHWRCLCRVQNSSLASCLFMMAMILQGLTAVVLIAGACAEVYAGTCHMLTNGWLSIGAAGGWLLASCFNREPSFTSEEMPRWLIIQSPNTTSC